MQAEDFDQGARDEILRGIDDAQTYATARKRMDRALMARGLIPFRAEISNPAARVAAKAAAGNGMPLHEIELKYAADMNESDWAEVVKISGDEELKAANKKQNKFFNEMLLKSGMKEFSGGVWKFKSEADALYVAEVQAAYEDMMNAKEFKSVEQQREWVFEQLARRRDPTAWFFGKYPTAREARSIPGAHIPYFIPPSARSAVVSELRARGVDVTEANIRDMYMEAVRAGTPSLEADFDELQTGLSNLPEGVPF